MSERQHMTCGNCGQVHYFKINRNILLCLNCGFSSEPCDFPDSCQCGDHAEILCRECDLFHCVACICDHRWREKRKNNGEHV